MFPKLRKMSTLDIEIEYQLNKLRNTTKPELYAEILGHLDRLYKMKEAETSRRVSPDTLALIGANLLGIMIIITHEYTNPITTKALQFAIKPK